MSESQHQAVQVDPRPKDITQNTYYQKLQLDLAQKKDAQQTQSDQAVLPKPEVQKPSSVVPVEDMVEIRSELNWKKDANGQFVVEAELSHISAGSTSIRMSRSSFTPYAINLASKTGQMLEAYSKQYVQARSHNVLFAKLAQMKCGFLLTLMAVMGVSWNEIQRVQKEALHQAIEENVKNFSENEYNSEMLQVISQGKDLKKQLMIIDDVRQQLIKQMKNFGDEFAYTPLKIMEIKKEQCQKVRDTFVQERENLYYQLDFM